MDVPDGFSDLGPLEDGMRAAVDDLAGRDAVGRLKQGDHTLWQDDPTEVADRLGWLHSPDEMQAEIDDLQAFAESVAADGFEHAVLMGMGGSSLFPEVLFRTFGVADGRLRLHVLDTTDPAAIARATTGLPLDHTLFIAASKSGTTIETTSQLAHFSEQFPNSSHFIAITDPGTALAELGEERGFRRVFENRPDIGGRYSALSYFGLVPGALLGVDLAGLLGRATAGRHRTETVATWLGAAMAAGVQQGRDKLTLVLPEEIGSFGLWLEQLIAESTGKRGTGIVPVADEPLGGGGVYGDDRLFVAIGGDEELPGPAVRLRYHTPIDLGRHVLLWEMATALAGAVLGINPFDQPNVAEAKAATATVLEEGLPDVAEEPLEKLLADVGPGDYLAIHAYVDPGSDVVERLQRARVALRDRLKVATTLGIGPRFLHSTGQLHKGGPPTGVFVQVVGDDHIDVPIPGQDYGFSTLKQAQAAGDLAALEAKGLRAARVSLEELLKEARS
ncbi:MAG: glucose-6-phosphate isomerase [Actinomycetota bacterium]